MFFTPVLPPFAPVYPRRGARNLFAWGRSDRCLGDWRGVSPVSGTAFLRNKNAFIGRALSRKPHKLERYEKERGKIRGKFGMVGNKASFFAGLAFRFGAGLRWSVCAVFLPPRDVARKYQCRAALHCFAAPGKGNAMVDAGRPACGPVGGKTLFPVLHGGRGK